MTVSNGMLRVTYYQEIIPETGTNPDFTVEPESITSKSDGIPPGGYLAGPLQGTFALDLPTFDRWRRMLCHAALDYDVESVWSSPDAFAGEPFFDLIQCEKRNLFGPRTSLRLAEDFKKWEERVELKVSEKQESNESQFFMDVYQLFMKAFRASSNGGCTIFSI